MALRRPDMPYAGKVVREYVKRRYGGAYKMVVKLDDPVPTSTYYAVTAGERYAADSPEAQRLELSLGFPLGTMESLAVQDFTALIAAGVPDALVKVARQVAAEQRPAKSERRSSSRTA